MPFKFNIKIKMLSDNKKINKRFNNVCGIMFENGTVATSSKYNLYIVFYYDSDKLPPDRINMGKILSIKIKAKKIKE